MAPAKMAHLPTCSQIGSSNWPRGQLRGSRLFAPHRIDGTTWLERERQREGDEEGKKELTSCKIENGRRSHARNRELDRKCSLGAVSILDNIRRYERSD